jgi:hypothetical protein
MGRHCHRWERTAAVRSRAAVHGKVTSGHHPAGRNHPTHSMQCGAVGLRDPRDRKLRQRGEVGEVPSFSTVYTRARTRAPTAQTYRSSPTSPCGAGSTIHPPETRGNQRAMPCRDAVAGARALASDGAGRRARCFAARGSTTAAHCPTTPHGTGRA